MDPEVTVPIRGERPRGLPAVAAVEIRPVRFEPPMRFYRKGRLVEEREAVELLLKTDGPLPHLDLTPVLFIGDIVVAEYEEVGVDLYRFVAYGIERLVPGSRIALGWSFAPQHRIPTRFSFALPGPLPVA